MSHAEIRKLLGGYATNTLTEGERKALFDAALDDQELFNALQDEDALKELLEDPVSRTELRRALEQPVTLRPNVARWARWWVWGSAAGAVAAAAILFAVMRPNQGSVSKPPVQIASAERAAGAAAPNPAAGTPKQAEPATASQKGPAAALRRQESERREVSAAPAGVPAPETREAKDTLARNSPPPAAPAPIQAEKTQVQSEQTGQLTPKSAPALQQGGQLTAGPSLAGGTAFRDSLAAQNSPPPLTSQVRAAVAGAAGNYNGPLLRSSLLRRDANGVEAVVLAGQELKSGDNVRIQVSTGEGGTLSLYQLDRAGVWQTVTVVPVQANSSYVVPANPIRVEDGAERFRLALQPGTEPLQKDSKLAMAKKTAAESAPLVTEIRIGPGRIP